MVARNDFKSNQIPSDSIVYVRTSGNELSVSLSGQLSGLFVEISGDSIYALGQSGIPFWQDTSGVVGVTILSGNLSSNISGQTVLAQILSGTVNVGSGFVSIGTPALAATVASVITDGRNASSALVTLPQVYNYDEYINQWNRVRVNLSGQGATSVATSGSQYIHVAGISGIRFWQNSSGALGVVNLAGISGSVTVQSGLVGTSVSGNRIFAAGLSGIPFWQDSSGVMGVTLLSGAQTSNISGQSVVTTASGIGLSGMPPRLFQLASGTLTSGELGAMAVAIGVYDPAFVSMVSGQLAMGRLTAFGAQYISVMDNNSTAAAEVQNIGTNLASPNGLVVAAKLFGMSGLAVWQDSSGVLGVTMLSGSVSANVSGNNVFAVGLSGIPYWQNSSGAVGVIILSGNISTTANVSGQNVYAVGLSGIPFWQNSSGAIGVILLSGNLSVTSDISGQAVRIAGQSGLFIPQTLSGFAHSGVNPGHLGVAALVEGTIPVRLSGQMGALSSDLSGNLRVTLGTNSVINVSSGNIVVTSGTFSAPVPTTGRSRGFMMVSSASGGTNLNSGDCISVSLRMLARGSGGIVNQSGFILVGFDAAGERPYASSSGIAGANSGYGMILYPGDERTFNLDNMNRLMVYSILSGEMISYGAVTM